MAKLRTRQDYQDNLDTIKAEGSLEKQSKIPNPKPKLRASRGDGRVPERGANVAVPLSEDGFGTSMFDDDRELRLPQSIFDVPSSEQQDILGQELREFRGQNQPGYAKLAAFVPRALAKTGIEFMKGLGFIASLPLAAIEGDLSKVVDNAFIEGLNELDEAIKEQIPVHMRREIENGGFWKQIGSPEFWGTEAADAVGFMASSVLAGWGTNTLLKGAVKGLIGNINKVNKFKNILTAEENVRLTATSLAQSYIESFAEADGTMRDFDKYWEQYDNGDGTYTKPDGLGGSQTISQAKLDSLRNELVGNTFSLNMGVTFLPNLFVSKALFGSGGVTKNLFTELGISTKTLEGMKDGVAGAMKKGSFVKAIAREGVTGAIAEGAQEGAQHAIQVYGERRSQGLEDINMVDGLVDGMVDAFSSVEGQKAMFLGALMGLGPGIKKGHREHKALVKRANKLTQLMDDNWTDLKKEVAGYIKVDEETGEQYIDEQKIQEDFAEAERTIRDVMKLEQAKLQGLPMQTKSMLAQMMVRKAMPYFGIEGGTEVLMNQVDQLTEVMADDAPMLGFASKEEIGTFIKDTFKVAKEKIDEARRKGPRQFGLDINKYRKAIGEDALTAEAMEAFYQQMEVQYAMNNVLLDYNQKELGKISPQLNEIISKINNEYAEAYPEGKATTTEGKMTALKKAKGEIEQYKGLSKNKAEAEYNIEKINENISMLFDKKQQQETLDNYAKIVELKKKSAASTREGQKRATELNNRFRDKMIELGYYANEEQLQQGINDGSINKKTIRLKDKKGRIWAFKKVGEGEGSKWYLFPIDNKTGEPIFGDKPEDTGLVVNTDIIEELGIDENSIMSIPEYSTFKKEVQLKRSNEVYLDKIASLIVSAENARERRQEKIEAIEETLEKINEEIEYWRTQDEIPIDKLADDILQLEQKKQEVESELAIARESLESARHAILFYEDMRLNLEDAIEQGLEFEPNLELQQLKEKLREGGAYQNSREKLRDLEFATIDDIKKLEKAQASLQEAIDELYFMLSNNKALKSLLENQSIGTADLVDFINNHVDYIREFFPEFLRDPQDINSEVVNFEYMDVLFNDKEIRLSFLKHLKSELKWQVPLYYQGKKELYNVTKQLEKAQENLKNINYYLKIQPLVETVMSRRDAQLREDMAGQSITIRGPQTYNKESRIEQSDTNDLTYPKERQKQWMYSTISTYYEPGKWIEKIPHSNATKLKQAKDWANAMYSIPLELLDYYSVKIVNAEGLKELGQTPPATGEDDLYAVVLQEGSPYRAKDGAIVFSGIAKVDKYFLGQGQSNINFENDPEYIRIEERDKKKPISKETPYTPPVPNAKPVTKKQDAIDELVERKKAEYAAWRKQLLDRAERKEDINLSIQHISRGWPAPADNSANQTKGRYRKNDFNPKKSLEIRELTIGKKYITLANGEQVETTPGMVYAILENGNAQRLINYRIGDLPSSTQNMILNRILNFMALVRETPDGKAQFTWAGQEGKPNSTIPLFGSSKAPGILDYFLNWNAKEDSWNIDYSQFKNGKKGFVYKTGIDPKTGKLRKHFVFLSDLLDKDGNVKKADSFDPVIRGLVEFLKTKYLNVIDKNTGTYKDKQGKIRSKWARIPKGVKKGPLGETQITFDNADSYDNYVMENYLYTQIPPTTENSNVPRFVNQYIIFSNQTAPIKTMDDVEENKKETTEEEKKQTFSDDNFVPTGMSMTELLEREEMMEKEKAEKQTEKETQQENDSEGFETTGQTMEQLAEAMIRDTAQVADNQTPEEKEDCNNPFKNSNYYGK